MTETAAISQEGLVVDCTVTRGTFEVSARFSATAGETIALLGPNGSGKSTLVAAIAGLLPPGQGTIGLDGVRWDSPGEHVSPDRRHIGVVFQDLLLFPHMTATENVAFPLRARGVDRSLAREAAATLLDRFGLAERASAVPADLSGGEAQRVALARALIAEPALLLLDEPLSALDVGTRARFREVVREELNSFPGIRIIVTHDPIEASMIADRLVLLENGRVTQIGTPEAIRAAPGSRYAAELVGVNAFVGRLSPMGGGAGRITTDEGEVVVELPEGSEGGDAIGVLRPVDVTISLERPTGSARNAFQGPVTSVTVDGGRARVRIGTRPPVVAELTAGSVDRLGLSEGRVVWASFKAVEVQIVQA